MAYFARVDQGIVAEVFSLPDDEDLTAIFHPDVLASIIPCGTEVQPSWLYEGIEFSAPPPLAPVEPIAVSIPANVFFQRTSDEEAEAIDAEMVKQTLRIQRQWQDPAVSFVSGTDLWDVLRGVIVELYSEERAYELLS